MEIEVDREIETETEIKMDTDHSSMGPQERREPGGKRGYT